MSLLKAFGLRGQAVFTAVQFGRIGIYSRNLHFIYRDHRATQGVMGPDREGQGQALT
jgi:hypothetical protein